MKIIASYAPYNSRRYSKPWVCKMTPIGGYDFNCCVGGYTGNDYKGNGEAGDLVVYEPEDGQVYGYGQKDHRGSNTRIYYALYRDGDFIPCDKLGRIKDN